MSEQVPRGFSWSASRHGMFEDCPRAYFFHYYLALGKARGADRARGFEAKRLRSMTSVPMWIGSCVHDAIESALKAVRAGEIVDLDRVREQMLERMRGDYVASRDDLAKQRRDYRTLVRFHEHEYGPVPEPSAWKAAADDAVEMFHRWGQLSYLPDVQSLDAGQILGIEDLDSWEFHGVPVWVKIDLAYRDAEGSVHILDWKTGRRVTPENPTQMTGYAIYAQRNWNVELEALRVREVYLRLENPEKVCEVSEETLALAQDKILESIRSMIGALENPAVNVAVEQDFPAAPADWRCSRCFFRGICEEKVINA